jgi:hypothetical protein
MLSEQNPLIGKLKDGAAIGFFSLLGTASIGGSMALLVYVHLMSLSTHQMVVL